ncbi:hepatitis A virus cellular receptor 1 homolog [Mesocricetus auratus]|uniref:Hepatitis A virus cellular receptor 1 homolog n=1 Tax=Mesocricetus auratus TaxID=10036 RepID=A0ABM2XP82_MESAU|nr:hepatitis A virus cellular receptor 1 homolog [Mesocricetus auratus]
MRPTHEPASPRVSTLTPTTPVHMETYKPDWNNSVISSNDSWNNYTESIPSLNPPVKMTKDMPLGYVIAAFMVMLYVGALALMR